MEIQGTIIQVLPLQSGVAKASGKEWKKQEYILETLDSQSPKTICFNLWGENVDKFALQTGEQVTVQIDLESREFNGRWYTDVKAWRVDRGLVSLQAPQPQVYPQPAPQPQGYYPPQQGYQAPQQGRVGADAQNNDLPF